MDFEPDYRHIAAAANNKRPSRLPVYEHYISPLIMEKALGKSFADLESGGDCDLREFFINFCRFFKEMTYDTVSYEFCITEILPDHGAIMDGILNLTPGTNCLKYIGKNLRKNLI